MTKQVSIPHHGKLLSALFDPAEFVAIPPLVLMAHGFTGWKEEEHLSTLARDLAATGIAAIRWDAPGSGHSDGTFWDDYYLSNYVDSVESVLAWAGDSFDGVAIWGHSMGGFVALHAAVAHPEFKAVCASQPSHGGSGVRDEEAKEWKRTGSLTLSNRRFPEVKLPYSFYEDRNQYDVLQEIGRLQMPLLLQAGSRDDVVKAASVKRIFDAAPEPKLYEEFGVNHFYKLAPGPMSRINTATVEFFKEALF